jgi:hypothetical protein
MDMAERSDLTRIFTTYEGVCALLPDASRGAQGELKKVSAKFRRNPLKRLISNERIQGNPSFSNPV